MVYIRECIISQKFINPTDKLIFNLPWTTTNLKRLDLKEIKIVINNIDIGSNTDYVTLSFQNLASGFIGDNTSNIVTVPTIREFGRVLYRIFQKDHLNILKCQAKQPTERDIKFQVQILKGDDTILLKDYIYLRFDAFYDEGFVRDYPESFQAQ